MNIRSESSLIDICFIISIYSQCNIASDAHHDDQTVETTEFTYKKTKRNHNTI